MFFQQLLRCYFLPSFSDVVLHPAQLLFFTFFSQLLFFTQWLSCCYGLLFIKRLTMLFTTQLLVCGYSSSDLSFRHLAAQLLSISQDTQLLFFIQLLCCCSSPSCSAVVLHSPAQLLFFIPLSSCCSSASCSDVVLRWIARPSQLQQLFYPPSWATWLALVLQV